MDEKICTTCKETKPLDAFFKSAHGKFGVGSKCRLCLVEWQRNNPNRKFNLIKYASKNRESINTKRREKYHCNLSESREYHRKKALRLRQTDRQGHRDKMKIWKKNEYTRRKNDPLYLLRRTLRGRFLRAVTAQFKETSVINLVGCSIEELRDYLQSKFKEGMNWENHGIHGWHIDHIKPCSSFNLSNLEEQKICFHYTNLQPLWAQDNLSKSDSYHPQ